MKIGVIGGGLIGQERLQALKRIIEISSHPIEISMVIDSDQSRLEKISGLYKCPVSSNLEDVFLANPDWIFICTPHEYVFEITKACFANNSNVLVEKPLGRSFKECNEILAIKPQYIRLAVGFNYRFYPGIRRAINDALNGVFGKIISVNMVLGHGNAPGMEKTWKLDPKKCGGGALIDPGIHLFDLVLCLSDGAINVLQGASWSGFWGTGIEEEAHVIMRDSLGTIFNIQASLNRWRSSFRLEINGVDGYGVVEGRGRSYGPQSYKVGKRWGWQSGSNQADSEELLIDSDPSNDSFFFETAMLLGIDLPGLGPQNGRLNVCDELQALKAMSLLDTCRKSLNLPSEIA
jgi:predicted dehydrogenase